MRSAQVGWSPWSKRSPAWGKIYKLAVGREEARSSSRVKQKKERVGLSGVFSSQAKADSSYSDTLLVLTFGSRGLQEGRSSYG